MPIGIIAHGAHVPPKLITNQDVERWTGKPAAQIEARTGIKTRRYATEDDPTSTLGILAVHDMRNRFPGSLDQGVGALICGTSSPNQPQPATAAIMLGQLFLDPVLAVDLNAVCSSGLAAMMLAAPYAASIRRPVLVVAADKYSPTLNRTDYRTASLFGDGASSMLLGEVPEGYGFLASDMVTHGDLSHLVGIKGGGTAHRLTAESIQKGDDRFQMAGRDVVDYVLATVPDLIRRVLDRAGLRLADINRLVCHQANPRLLAKLAQALGFPMDRVPITADRFGNTGCASMGITFAETHFADPIQRGQHVLFLTVGGGMNAAALVMRKY